MITIGPEPHATHQAQSNIRSSPEASASTTKGNDQGTFQPHHSHVGTTNTTAKQGAKPAAIDSDAERQEQAQESAGRLAPTANTEARGTSAEIAPKRGADKRQVQASTKGGPGGTK